MDRLRIKIEIKFVVLIVGTLLTILASWYFTKSNPTFEKVIDILKIGLTFSALVYTAMSINACAQVNKSAVIVQKRKGIRVFGTLSIA